MKQICSVFSVLIASFAAVIPVISSADDIKNGQMNSILASVNGEAITLVDVLPLTSSKELQARSVYHGERLEKVILDYRRKMVDELIDNLLIQKEFAKYKFVLSNQEIEREVDEFAIRVGCRSREQLERYLRKNGGTMEEIRMGIRKNMMVQLMLYRQIQIADPVSPKELHEYFQNNREKFSSPEKVSLAMLKLKNDLPDLEKEIQRVSAQLNKNPEDFSKLAVSYAPELNDGNLGEIDVKLLRPEFAQAFNNVFTINKIAGPLKDQDSVFWLKVIAHKPAESFEFSAVEEKIKLELERSRREKIVLEYTGKLRNGAVVEYYF